MSNEPMAKATDIVVTVPSTPPAQTNIGQKSARSPTPKDRPASTATPLMTAQPRRTSQVPDTTGAELLLTPTTSRVKAARDLPTVDRIDHAGADELRNMVKSLVGDLTEARVTTANAKLQHHLLTLQTNQAAERAEVENQLSRRQVDFLRSKQHKSPSKPLLPTTSAVQLPSMNDTLTQNLRDLEEHCERLEEMCEQLKREKELQAERIQSLSEHNTLLVNRIKENREHFTRIRAHSPIFMTPREAYTTPRRRGYSRYQDDTPAHAPFAALIAADQILSQETASVPSTPTKTHTGRAKQGHSRGAHSLSSIQTPKNHVRPSTSDGFLGSQLVLSAPGSQLVNESAERERHDRDSTISISDHDNNIGDDVLAQSQASSLAADMLRNNPTSFENMRGSEDAEKTSNLLQSKLFGNVKKPSGNGATKLKRAYGFDDSSHKKRVRTEEQVGLGIEA
ncbi:hypothetical protein H2198_007942 [Neophaeococcomyces mojaviensis]|uniref:Uncharacterized protein n=1 Tax=Neophaeococcomyces mojaviensis TaxID=3383035 RepID=A0ACC2ZYH1_9EURO|nr:hypothetical protein H2198_007942 [Knufia sp. JES_112]